MGKVIKRSGPPEKELCDAFVMVNMTKGDLAALDQRRGKSSRSSFVRWAMLVALGLASGCGATPAVFNCAWSINGASGVGDCVGPTPTRESVIFALDYRDELGAAHQLSVRVPPGPLGTRVLLLIDGQAPRLENNSSTVTTLVTAERWTVDVDFADAMPAVLAHLESIEQ